MEQKKTRKKKQQYQKTIYDNDYVRDIYNVVPVLTDGKFPMKNGILDESFDDFIIPCMRSKCGFIYTTHNTVGNNEIFVALITSKTVSNDINANCKIKFLKVIDNEEGGKNHETEYHLLDKDLKEFDRFVKIATGGAKTSPFKKGVVENRSCAFGTN